MLRLTTWFEKIFKIKSISFGNTKSIYIFAKQLQDDGAFSPDIKANKMTIYESKELKALANLAGLTTNAAAETIVSHLIENDIIEDEPDFYGAKINEVYDGSVGVSKFIQLVEKLGLPNRMEHVFTIINLQLFGEYDCEECGGETEVTDSEQKCVGGDGWETPFEYVNVWEEKTCCVCGNKTSNEPDFD